MEREGTVRFNRQRDRHAQTQRLSEYCQFIVPHSYRTVKKIALQPPQLEWAITCRFL